MVNRPPTSTPLSGDILLATKNTPAVHIVGWSHSKFGKYDLLEPETLMGDMQLPGAQLAGVFNMGGVAVANYASILERSA